MVATIKNVLPPDVVSKGCVLRKHHQEPFDSGNAWRVPNLLELDHSDLYCINNPSLSIAWYVLTFIDALSHYTWVYLLKNMSNVFE